jgi:hypothetical protein
MTPLQVMQALLKKVHEKDLDGLMSFLADDCSISQDRNELLVSGKDALREFYKGILDRHSEMKIELADNFTVGSVLAVREINRGMMVDGKPQDVDTVWIYQIVNEKVNLMHVFSPDSSTTAAIKNA